MTVWTSGCVLGVGIVLAGWAGIAANAAEADRQAAGGERAGPIEGIVRFDPTEQEPQVPEMFRLSAGEFAFRQEPQPVDSRKVDISLVTFPSPVVTPHENNNTVHCEWFRPRAPGRYPAVVVLHILGGDFELSRLFARQLAHHEVGALFLKMPYYGPRRQPGVDRRMVSVGLQDTVEGMRQAVLDIRRAAAWLAAQDNVDADRLGVFGISLGGITSALAATAEPRFQNVCLMLAGGDIGQVAWEHPELDKVRQAWLAEAGTKERVFELLRSVDPVTYGDRARGRRILMLNASQDEVIPRGCTESLWRSFGEPEIRWYDAGHYSVARFMFDGLAQVTRFFHDSAAAGPATPAD